MMKVVLGGAWYRSQLDVRTMTTIVGLVTSAHLEGATVVRLIAEDGPLDISRNKLLELAIPTGADWFLSIDSDCSIGDARAVFRAMRAATSSAVALVGFPARENSGRWNVIDLQNQRVTAPARELVEVARVGFGAVAFRLGWYVKHWPRDVAPFQTVIVRDDVSKRWAAIGEDFGHCNAVRSLGGRVLADGRVPVEHHMSRAGAVEVAP